MREIVWGFGTLADVDGVGDVVIGGCVVDVDTQGRVAVAQCPNCGIRADSDGVALERPQPAPVAHPFDVSFSSPPSTEWEVGMSEQYSAEQSSAEPSAVGAAQPAEAMASTAASAEPGSGSAASAAGTWRDRVEPYSSHDVQLPPQSAPAPDRVEPYSSHDDSLPDGGAAWPDRVEPYTSRGDDAPPASAPHRDAIDPYASREDPLPEGGSGWRERVEPFVGRSEFEGPTADEPAEPAPGDAEPAATDRPQRAEGPAISLDGELLDDRSLDGSDFSGSIDDEPRPGES